MEFNPDMFVSADELHLDVRQVLEMLEKNSRIYVMSRNKPQFIITTLNTALVKNAEPMSVTAMYKPQTSCDKEGKVGQLVQNTFRYCSVQNNLPAHILDSLCSPDYCSNVFSLSYPVLKRYDEKKPFDLQKRDENGYNRYYNYTLRFGDNLYLLCSQWTERNRKPFLQWLAQRNLSLENPVFD